MTPPFGLLLRIYRISHGVSQRTLAEQVGLSERVLSSIETGRRRPPPDFAFAALKKACGLSAAEIQRLRDVAGMSSYRVRIPSSASAREILLVHRLIRSIGTLSTEQIEQLTNTLGVGGISMTF